jgi:hypothetical protein
MTPTDLAPDALLRRDALAAALTDAGYKTAPSTLATMASRGGGPPYRRYGRVPLYTWGEGLAWARSRLSPRINATAELDAKHVA